MLESWLVWYFLSSNIVVFVCQGTDAVEGTILDVSQISDLPLSYETFSRMINIRFLKFYMGRGRTCNLLLPSGLKSLPNKLMYLQWDGYPSKSLPSTFCTDNLVVLSMMESHVEKLWDGIKVMSFILQQVLYVCAIKAFVFSFFVAAEFCKFERDQPPCQQKVN